MMKIALDKGWWWRTGTTIGSIYISILGEKVVWYASNNVFMC